MENYTPYYVCDWCELEEPVPTADNANWVDITFSPLADKDGHSHLELCAKCYTVLQACLAIIKDMRTVDEGNTNKV